MKMSDVIRLTLPALVVTIPAIILIYKLSAVAEVLKNACALP